MEKELNEYFEQEINPGPFADILPKGARIVESPKLPVLSFMLQDEKWEVSDLRLLNPEGVHALKVALQEVCETGNDEVSFCIGKDADEDLVRIVKAILLGFRWSTYRMEEDEYPNYSSSFIYGIEENQTGNERIMTAKINPTCAKAFHRYAEEQGRRVSLYLMLKAARDELEAEINGGQER